MSFLGRKRQAFKEAFYVAVFSVGFLWRRAFCLPVKPANQCVCHANLIGCQGFEVIRTHWIRDVMFSVIKVFPYKNVRCRDPWKRIDQ